MSIEYCFNCDAHYDTDFEEWCPKCEQLKALSHLFKGINSEMQFICEITNEKKNEKTN